MPLFDLSFLTCFLYKKRRKKRFLVHLSWMNFVFGSVSKTKFRVVPHCTTLTKCQCWERTEKDRKYNIKQRKLFFKYGCRYRTFITKIKLIKEKYDTFLSLSRLLKWRIYIWHCTNLFSKVVHSGSLRLLTDLIHSICTRCIGNIFTA